MGQGKFGLAFKKLKKKRAKEAKCERPYTTVNGEDEAYFERDYRFLALKESYWKQQSKVL